MSSAFGCSSSTISAFAVMLALSSLPGLSIDTFTSKLVTLSFSTPSGEICVTWPLNVAILERLDADARRLVEPHAADVGLVHLAAHEDLLDVAERHHERRVGAEVENRRHRAADLDVAAEDRGADRRADRGVGEVLGVAVGRGLRLRHLRPRLGDLRFADRQLRLRGALAVFGHVDGAVRIVERGLRDQPLARTASARGRSARRANSTSGPSASTMFFLSAAWAPSSDARAA